jgi:Glutaredoxin
MLYSWKQTTLHTSVQIEAEKVPDLSAHLNVTSVPTTVFLSKGNVVDRVEGFQPGILFEKADANKPVPLQARLKQLTTSQPVMLFMKGTPEAPRCGFSKRVVAALQQDGIPFGHFDILSDEEVCPALIVLAVHCSACTPPLQW